MDVTRRLLLVHWKLEQSFPTLRRVHGGCRRYRRAPVQDRPVSHLTKWYHLHRGVHQTLPVFTSWDSPVNTGIIAILLQTRVEGAPSQCRDNCCQSDT
ncbi:hypothetical protein BgiMline_033862 [Biomphalaria glabrata]|nr:hypothetical protein BgiBS90_035740 [Biomphalaria glabrata]KAI8739184.1 hypothetical protein BgiMline_024917 [Biomphalaria glabrata]